MIGSLLTRLRPAAFLVTIGIVFLVGSSSVVFAQDETPADPAAAVDAQSNAESMPEVAVRSLVKSKLLRHQSITRRRKLTTQSIL